MLHVGLCERRVLARVLAIDQSARFGPDAPFVMGPGSCLIDHAVFPSQLAAAQTPVKWLLECSRVIRSCGCWGSPRIVDEMRKLGIEVAKSTVEKYRIRPS